MKAFEERVKEYRTQRAVKDREAREPSDLDVLIEANRRDAMAQSEFLRDIRTGRPEALRALVQSQHLGTAVGVMTSENLPAMETALEAAQAAASPPAQKTPAAEAAPSSGTVTPEAMAEAARIWSMSNRELARLARSGDRVGDVLLRGRLDPLVVIMGAKMGVSVIDIGEFGAESPPIAIARPAHTADPQETEGALMMSLIEQGWTGEAIRMAERVGLSLGAMATYGPHTPAVQR